MINYDELREKFSDFVGMIIDENGLGFGDMDIGFEYDFENMSESLLNFIKQLEFRRDKNDYDFEMCEDLKNEM